MMSVEFHRPTHCCSRSWRDESASFQERRSLSLLASMSGPASSPRFHGEPPLYLTSRLLTEAGLVHLFSTRHLPGVRPWRDPAGPFDASALDFFATRGMCREPVAFLRQVHGAEVLTVREGGLVGSADILTTDRPGLPLAIFTADCLAIVVFDPLNRRLA